MNKETWGSISNFENYQVSNFGRVKRKYKNGNIKILKNGIDKDGYYIVSLCFNNKKTTKRVNILVAQAFIPNPNNYPVVNHINGIKTDNRVENLEWCSYKHNMKEAYRIGLCKPTKYFLGKYGENSANAKKIVQKDKNNNIIKYFYGCLEASRETGINFRNINSCCNGKRLTAGGYIWKYLEKENEINYE